MTYGAIDLHSMQSQVRIVTDTGEIIDRRIPTTRDPRARALWTGKVPGEPRSATCSSGFSSTRSITVGSFRATCGRWVLRSRRSTVRRRTIRECERGSLSTAKAPDVLPVQHQGGEVIGRLSV